MIINYNDSIYIAAVNQVITWEFNPFKCLCLCIARPEISTSYVLYCILLVVNCLRRRELLDRCVYIGKIASPVFS